MGSTGAADQERGPLVVCGLRRGARRPISEGKWLAQGLPDLDLPPALARVPVFTGALRLFGSREVELVHAKSGEPEQQLPWRGPALPAASEDVEADRHAARSSAVAVAVA